MIPKHCAIALALLLAIPPSWAEPPRSLELEQLTSPEVAALQAQVLQVDAETLRRDPQLKLAWTAAGR